MSPSRTGWFLGIPWYSWRAMAIVLAALAVVIGLASCGVNYSSCQRQVAPRIFQHRIARRLHMTGAPPVPHCSVFSLGSQ